MIPQFSKGRILNFESGTLRGIGITQGIAAEIDIFKRYTVELSKISNHLTELEKGRIYELTKMPGTPSCATLAEHLREDIATLLEKNRK